MFKIYSNSFVHIIATLKGVFYTFTFFIIFYSDFCPVLIVCFKYYDKKWKHSSFSWTEY